MEEVLVPLGFFSVVPVTVWIVMSLRAKRQAATNEVLKELIQRGDEITPETIQNLGYQAKTPHRDLKTGLILIALAAAFLVLGGAIPEDEAPQVMRAIASFPFFIGLVYTAFWVLFSRKQA